MKHPFWKYVLVTFLAVLTAVTVILYFYFSTLNPELRQIHARILHNQLAYVLVIVTILGGALYLGLDTIFKSYIKPLNRISAETTTIYSSNHSHRIKIDGNSDIVPLLTAINGFAEKLEYMDKNITEEILAARKETEKERNLLAAIMAELPQGVVICNNSGRILLFNNLARTILTCDPDSGVEKLFIGIGRSLFKLVDERMIQNALKRIEQKLQEKRENTAFFFVTPIQAGHLISAETIPVLDQHQNMTGFIFAFQDVTEDVKKFDIVHEKISSIKQDLIKHHQTVTAQLQAVSPAGRPIDNPHTNNLNNNQQVIATLDSLVRRYDEISDIVLDALNPETALKRKKRTAVVTASRPEFYDFDMFQAGEANIEYILDTRLTDLMYTVFDTETTGLDPDGGDEIISIGAVRIANNKIIYQDLFDELIDPKRDIPLESYNIHGINYEMVAGKKEIKEILPVFKNYTSQSVLVGHNIAFDMKMLKVKEAATGVEFTNPVLDTLLLSAVLHPAHESHNLESIAKRLGIDIVGRHTALGDAIATAEIFLKMISILNSNGILTLKDAVAASQKTYYARLKY